MERNKIKISFVTFIIIIIVALVVFLGVILHSFYKNRTEEKVKFENLNGNIDTAEYKLGIVDNHSLSAFDLSFLKLENKQENKIYSPLSIKYALKMLEEGANGNTKEQISKIIGPLDVTKYKTNQNMALANSIFIRDNYKNRINQSYIDNLKDKYNAEVNFDSFKDAKNINNWIKNRTLNIIPNIIEDDAVRKIDFALVNALAIDMEWNQKFLLTAVNDGPEIVSFPHEKRKANSADDFLGLNVYNVENVSSNIFKNDKKEQKISGMIVDAAINNYDIVNELGEENIKQIVSEEYRKFAKNEKYDTDHAFGDFPLSEDISDEGIEKDLKEFIPNYIKEIKQNYHKYGTTTEFLLYVDDDVKVFAKDLKKYGDTTLQYIGIMPKNENLDSFVRRIDNDKIKKYIKNLKSIDYRNFNEGVVTKITGFIPKFKFDYNLNLMEDLKKQNITDVFDSQKADLKNITDDSAYINTALHKASIEFTQDGIKAAAATILGGYGAGEPFDYYFDVPVEEIDITFDRPYMFLIKDKQTEDIWFIGTVYEPLLWKDEPENMYEG